MKNPAMVHLTVAHDTKIGCRTDRPSVIVVRPSHILSLRELGEYTMHKAHTEVVLNEGLDEDCGKHVRRELRCVMVVETVDQIEQLMDLASRASH